MRKYDKDQYVQIFQKLPPELKDAVSSDETIQKIKLIGDKHHLHIDQTGVLVDLTFDVIMGIIPAKYFSREISENVKVSLLEASAIGHDIDEGVFLPIKKIMLAIYEDGAPNKPGSSLVEFYEEDEDHESLNAEHILHEIENPTESIVKKETTSIPIVSMPTKIVAPTSTPVKIEPTNIPKPEVATSIEEAKERIIKKTDEMDLNKVFIMPKEGINTSPLNAIKSDLSGVYKEDKSLDVPPLRNQINKTLSSTSSKPVEKIAPQTPSAPTRTVDPYREKI